MKARKFLMQMRALLQPKGLDILQPLSAQLYNQHVPPDQPRWRLPEYGRAGTLAVVVGNSAALWRPFTTWLAADHPARIQRGNPVDTYVQQQMQGALARCSSVQGVRFELRLATDVGPRYAHMVQAARLSGLAYASSATQLCWHPRYGPWFALRALLVVDADYLTAAEAAKLLAKRTVLLPDPGMEQKAAATMQRLLQQPGSRELGPTPADWRDWAAVREVYATHTGQLHAYPPDMLEYHYTKDNGLLMRVVEQHRAAAKQLPVGDE